MKYNKFIKKNGEVLLDLTSDTVTADKLLSGVTAHDKYGEVVMGSYEGSGGVSLENCTVTLLNYADQAIGTIVSEGKLQFNYIFRSISDSGDFVKTVQSLLYLQRQYSKIQQ